MISIEKLKEEYKPGDEIILYEMKGEPQMEYGLKGKVVAVDDIGQVHVAWENGSSLALNVEEDFFEKIKANIITVIIVEPEKEAKITEIDSSLKSMQSIVGGYIEEYMPFEDEVAIICNEEGKVNGLPLNRAIYESNGKISDVIAGPFILCYAPLESGTFQSMPDHLQEKYLNQFKNPEKFYRTDKGIRAISYTKSATSLER